MEALLSRVVNVSEFMPLFTQLVTLGRNNRIGSGLGYLGDNKKQTIEIGTKLDKAGGLNLMLLGLAKVRKELGNLEARELEVAWDGIGEWWG